MTSQNMKILRLKAATCISFAPIALLNSEVSAFVQPSVVGRVTSSSGHVTIPSTRQSSLKPLQMGLSTIVTAESANAVAFSSGLLLAETEPWVKPVAFALGPFLNFISFAMVSQRKGV